MPSDAPEAISHYRVVRLLGAGGMGEVYLARDSKLDRNVALKILREELARDEERMRRFVREAKAASALSHPNVAQIYEIGEDGGLHFIAMEHVEGERLDARIGGRPLKPAEVIEIGIEVADALDEAHSKGIIHRDIKPANTMITLKGRVKVLDFGLAKLSRPSGPTLTDDAATQTRTTTGVVLGTVQYMSPEQALGHEVDPRTDIFSLGVMLYEMASGHLPFTGTTAFDTIDSIVHSEPRPIGRFNEGAPPELCRIIYKALQKDRERRYQTARDLLIDLKNLKRESDPALLTKAPLDREPSEPGFLRRVFAFAGPTARRWWEADLLLAVLLLTPLWIYLAWQVKGADATLGGLTAFFAILLSQAVTTTLRLYLVLVSVIFEPGALSRQVQRVTPWIRGVDTAFMVVLLSSAAVLATSRIALAALLLGLAVAGFVKFHLIDPILLAEAFPSAASPERGADPPRAGA